MKKLLLITSVSAIVNVLRFSLNILVGKVIAVYLGPSGVALSGQFQNFSNLLFGLAGSPFNTAVVKYTAENRSGNCESMFVWWKSAWIISTVLISLLIFAILSFSQVLSVRLLHSDSYKWVFQIYALCLPVVAIGCYLTAILNGYGEYNIYFRINIYSMLIAAAATIGLTIKFGFVGVIISLSFNPLFIGVVSVFNKSCVQYLKKDVFLAIVSTHNILGILKYVSMSVSSLALNALSSIIARDILMEKVGLEIAGQWQAVYKITELFLSVFMIALNTHYLPALSSSKTSLAIRETVKQTMYVIIPICASAATLIFFTKSFIVSFLLSDSFSYSKKFFLVLLISSVIKMASWILAYPMLSQGKFKWFVLTEIAFSLTFILATKILVDKYGAEGASFAVFLNASIYLIFISCVFNRLSKIQN